jgi:hypothetical protein
MMSENPSANEIMKCIIEVVFNVDKMTFHR